jgi:hypothetical protein
MQGMYLPTESLPAFQRQSLCSMELVIISAWPESSTITFTIYLTALILLADEGNFLAIDIRESLEYPI